MTEIRSYLRSSGKMLNDMLIKKLKLVMRNYEYMNTSLQFIFTMNSIIDNSSGMHVRIKI